MLLVLSSRRTALTANCEHLGGVGRKRPKKQGCYDTVVSAKIAQTLNVRGSRQDPRRFLKFAAYPRGTVSFKRAKFGKPVVDSFWVMSYDEVALFDRILHNNFWVSSVLHPKKWQLWWRRAGILSLDDPARRHLNCHFFCEEPRMVMTSQKGFLFNCMT